MNLVSSLVGGLFAIGLLVVASAFMPASKRPARPLTVPPDVALRVVRSVAIALLVAILTRWPVAALAAGLLGWFFNNIFGAARTQQAEIARTEAVATWTEMLRDTLSGAHGLEETIATSAGMAPEAIRSEVIALATALDRESLDVALQRFASDLAHPTADLVVTALRLAATDSTRDLADLLGTLADAARDECGMRLRVEAARARMRTAVRVITSSTLLTAVGLAVLNRQYLAVYNSAAGQVVLALVVAFWVVGLHGLHAWAVLPHRNAFYKWM